MPVKDPIFDLLKAVGLCDEGEDMKETIATSTTNKINLTNQPSYGCTTATGTAYTYTSGSTIDTKCTITESIIDELVKSGKVELTEKYKKERQAAADKKKKADDILHYRRTYGNAKVIINNPAVILMIDGKKYVSKAMPGDAFDPEKGLLMCLLKWKGSTNSDMKRLLKSAHVVKE